MNPLLIRLIISAFLGVQLLSSASLWAVKETLAMPAGEELTVDLRTDPMPKTGATRLGKILARYYAEGLGGSDNWEKVRSLKVSGRLKLESGEYDFAAYQKKPHYIKMTVEGPQRDLVLGYDGREAWRFVPDSGKAVAVMEGNEARRFIHSAHFGNHLLFPFAEGKQIDYIDTMPVEGAICHQIRVTLSTGYQVDYFIDVKSYLEIKVVNVDLRTDFVNTIVYQDYIREFGMPIAKRVDSYEGDQWVSQLELEEVRVNSGVMPWMFEQPR